MASSVLKHLRTHVVGYLALLVALSGTAYAAGKIDGKQIRKNSIPGNRVTANTLPGNRVKPNTLNENRVKAGTVSGDRLRFETVTGEQIDESSLGAVPQATNAASAENASRLGGLERAGFGGGIVSGLIQDPENGGGEAPPFGIFDTQTDEAVFGVAPADFVIRDFVAVGWDFVGGGESFELTLRVIDSSGTTDYTLCTVTDAEQICEAAGAIKVTKDSFYRLDTEGSGLPAAGSGRRVGFQYRAAAG